MKSISFFKKIEKTNLLLIILSILFSFIWSLNLFFSYNDDYGTYYAGAMYYDKNYVPYVDENQLKGVLYFLFLKFISNFMGFGMLQSYVSLSITLFIFLLTILFVISKKTENFFLKLVYLFISFGFFYKLNTNVSIAVFQYSLLLLCFYYGLCVIVNRKKILFNISLSWFCFVLACFVRIDSLIFFPIILFLLIHIFVSRSKKEFINILAVFVFLFIAIYYFLSSYFNLTVLDFYNGQILYPLFYLMYDMDVDAKSFLFRRSSIEIVSSNGFLIILILVVSNLFSSLRIKIFKFYKNNLSIIYTSMIALLGLIQYIFIFASDKDYYLFTLYIPIFFYLIINNESIMVNKKIINLIFIFTLISSYIWNAPILYKSLYKYPECIKNYLCDQSPLKNNQIVINELKINNKLIIIGNVAWNHVASDVPPHYPIYNWLLYMLKNPNEKEYVNIDIILSPSIKLHNKYLKTTDQEFIFVNKQLIKKINNNENKYLNKLLGGYTKISDEENYIKYKKII
jgi:hypothetical protein